MRFTAVKTFRIDIVDKYILTRIAIMTIASRAHEQLENHAQCRMRQFLTRPKTKMSLARTVEFKANEEIVANRIIREKKQKLSLEYKALPGGRNICRLEYCRILILMI